MQLDGDTLVVNFIRQGLPPNSVAFELHMATIKQNVVSYSSDFGLQLPKRRSETASDIELAYDLEKSRNLTESEHGDVLIALSCRHDSGPFLIVSLLGARYPVLSWFYLESIHERAKTHKFFDSTEIFRRWSAS